MPIIFFAGLFLLIWTLNSGRLTRPFLDDVTFLYTVITFFIVWFNYFTLSNIFFGIKNPIKWFILIVSLVLLYFFSLYSLIFPLKFMYFRYPDTEKLKYLYEGLHITSYKTLISPRGPAFLSEQLYLFLFIFFAGSIVFSNIDSMKKVTELELSNASQEMDLLKSKIHPQFLLNTLNSLYLMTKDNGKACEVVAKLSDLLKFTLYDSNEAFIPLKVELSFLQDYIELEKIRHHDHVRIEYDFSTIEEDEIQIAPLLFINFIENAFKHGVNKTRGSSWVKIKLVQKSDIVEFNVANSKPKKYARSSIGGKGLENITRRLKLLYPESHQLTIENKEEVYTIHLKINLT
jgi:sensor histidine kinase YesM